MTKLAEVTTLYETNCRSVPDMMREAANNIEGETEEHNRTVAVIAVQIVESGDAVVYGWGKTDYIHSVGSLQMGIHTLLQNKREAGE